MGVEKWNGMEVENRVYKIEERNKEPIKTNWSSPLRHSVCRFDQLDKLCCFCVVQHVRTFAVKRRIILLKFIKALARYYDYIDGNEEKKDNKEINNAPSIIICFLNDAKLLSFNYLYLLHKKFIHSIYSIYNYSYF